MIKIGEINGADTDAEMTRDTGLSLNTDGTVIALGEWYGGDDIYPVSDRGLVRVFEYNNENNWIQRGQETPTPRCYK